MRRLLLAQPDRERQMAKYVYHRLGITTSLAKITQEVASGNASTLASWRIRRRLTRIPVDQNDHRCGTRCLSAH